MSAANAGYAQAHEMAHPPSADTPKISLLPGSTHSAASYCILEEDHTLGNLIRWMVMKNPKVEFCGYSAPHPSEAKIHIRIQMYDGASAFDALNEALDNLEAMTLAVQAKYDDSLAAENYQKKEDLPMDFESVNERLWAAKEARGDGSRAEFEAERAARLEAEEAEKQKKAGKKPKAVKANR